MSQLVWSRQATSDLARIAEFVREYDARKEQQVTDLLISGVGQLRSQPQSGQQQEVLPDGTEIRSLLIGKVYRVKYLLTGSGDVSILQIIDVRSGQSR